MTGRRLRKIWWATSIAWCAAMIAGCGSSPSQPATSSGTSSVLTSSVTTTSIAQTPTSAHYAGTVTQTPPLPPLPLDMSLFFTVPGGSLRPASAARPIQALAVNFLVTGGYSTGPGGFSGSITGTLDGSPSNGTFTGTLTANLANGCVASRNYSGPLTATALNWTPGSQIETCGGASPLTFTVAPPAAPTPPTTSVPGTSTIPACTYTLSIGPTIDGYPTGGTFSATVTTTGACTWTAISNAPWIHVTAGNTGSGTGTVTFTADANNSPARTGTVTIAGQTITFNQSSAVTTTSSTSTTTISGTTSTIIPNFSLALSYNGVPSFCQPYTFTFSPGGSNCTVPPNSPANGSCPTVVYQRGTVVRITAAQSLAGWNGCDSSQGNVCTVTMTTDKFISATVGTSCG
jgi:hypothetical protein